MVQEQCSLFPTMKQLIFVIGFLVLCTHQKCWSFPVGTTLGEQELLYSYEGRIDTGSSAWDARLSRWSVNGYLIVELLENSIVFKLHNLTTTLFNGLREDLNNHENKFEKIPTEVAILEQPFVLHPDYTLSVQQNESLWSVNFKRGVASNFHEVIEGINQEKFVYGNCETNTISKDGVMVKTVNHNECENTDFKHLTNVRPAPAPKDFNPIHRKTVINVKFAPGKAYPPESIHTDSVLNYTSMPKVPYSQHIQQYSALNLISTNTEFEHINIARLTEKRDIFFEYGTETTQGRHKYETDSLVLGQQFLKSYEAFETVFEQIPLENRKNTTEDPVDDMYLALKDMPDGQSINNLREMILSKKNRIMYETFLSLLSYVGTEQAVNVINEMISKSDLLKVEFSGLMLLATFPNYIREATEELVQSLEGMLEVQNVKLASIRDAQILSFASVVDRAYRQKYLSPESLTKYRTIYFDKFIGSESYEDKMIYLLGLVNMADALPFDFKVSIITNTSLPANLRSLALAGFKNTLKITDSTELFDKFWRIVVNNEENFDVRIESLDLLLSANLSEDQFYTIVKESRKLSLEGIHGKHLLNYVVSTLESIQNKTAYREPLSNLATEAIQNKEFPVYPRNYWQTGNYRLSYSDKEPNLGAYIQARCIGVPETGGMSTVQFSYNQFDWSFDRGVYSIYLKVQGFLEYVFMKEFLMGVPQDRILFELEEIIKKFNYQMKNQNEEMHVDIVVFNDDKVVYATSLNRENVQQKSTALENLLMEMLLHTFHISYPVVDYNQMPSLLGTPLSINNDMQYIEHLSFKQNDFLYRFSWYFQTWLESYNPILDTTLSSFKYYGDEKGVRAKVAENVERMVFVWATKNDTFNWASDKLIGTDVDNEELLHRFCPICDGVTEIPTNFSSHSSIKNAPYLGAKYNHTHEQFENIDETIDFFLTISDAHISNSDAIPFAETLLAFLHLIRHTYYLQPDISRRSYRSIEVKDDGVQTIVHFEKKSDALSLTVDPYADTHTNHSITIITKGLDEIHWVKEKNYITFWQILLERKSTHNYTDENGKPKVKFTQNLYFTQDKMNDTSEDGGSQISSSRVELLPPINANIFNIVPPEDGTALNIIRKKCKNNNDTTWIDCNNITITLTEVYTAKEEFTKEIMKSPFYEQCLDDSKNWKYTPPTNSCAAANIAMSRYDKYTLNMKTQNLLNDMGIENLDINPVTYEFVEIDQLKYDLFLPFLDLNETRFYHRTMYFPYKAKNPSADANNDHDIFRGLKRTCTISPREIHTFTGNYIPNSNTNMQVAAIECIQTPRRVIKFQKISDRQINVEFTSRNYTVVGTVNENKLKVTLNNEELKESHLNVNEKISIRFLDENAVIIADDTVGIYYNTEFIQIKAKSLYKNIICGVCDE